MIDEHWTWIFYGYHSDELKPRSAKPIIVACDDCNRYAVVKKYAYSEYCSSCVCSGERHHMFGKHHTEEVKKKIGEASKKENLSEETLQKMRESAKRENLSDETIIKMRNSHMAENLSDETRMRMSESGKGRTHTEDAKRRIGEASARRTRIPHTHETRHKISATKQNVSYNEWRGFASPRRNLLMATNSYKNWRNAVFARDDYTCQMCNVRGWKLEAHHIIPVRDTKNMFFIFDIDNGITLCLKCHNKTKMKEYEFVERFESIIRGK